MDGDFDSMQFFIDVFIGMLIGGMVGALIGRCRGRLVDGLGWGIILGPIGWLIVALLKDKRPRCIECGGVVIEGARKCLHCGSAIEKIFTIRCPACGERGQLRESRMSEQIECPACKRVFAAAKALV